MSPLIIERFQQESTWRGIITVIMAVGVVLNPDQIEAVVSVGLAIVGLINICKKD